MLDTDRLAWADALDAARQSAGLSQSQLARHAGISPSRVSSILSGKGDTPTLRTMARLARACGARLTVTVTTVTVSSHAP